MYMPIYMYNDVFMIYDNIWYIYSFCLTNCSSLSWGHFSR